MKFIAALTALFGMAAARPEGVSPVATSPPGPYAAQAPFSSYSAPVLSVLLPQGAGGAEGSALLPGSRAPAATLELPAGTRVDLRDQHQQYSHGFKDLEGTQVSEQGRLISTNDWWEAVIAKEGSFSYTSPEGIPISVKYIADEKGFRIIP